ncbi:hypothetical protein BC940DRAFT_367966 [Gongronella butleri]|nr:hypothetical protein BC940DRAFT_367966 [Gongronella butleri]
MDLRLKFEYWDNHPDWIDHGDTCKERVHHVWQAIAIRPKRQPQELEDYIAERTTPPDGTNTLEPSYYDNTGRHLLHHLGDILRDHGPTHGHWLFAFERYNSDLKKNNTNNLPGLIEKTQANQFVQGTFMHDFLDAYEKRQQQHATRP